MRINEKKIHRWALWTLALLLTTFSTATAATISWINPTGGNWGDSTNWDAGVVPGSSDDVLITMDGDYTVTMDEYVTVNNLTVGAQNGTQTLDMEAGSLQVRTFLIGSNASFNVNYSGQSSLIGSVVTNHGNFNVNASLAISDQGIPAKFINLGTVVLGNSLLVGEWNNTGSTGSSFNNLGTILVPAETYGWLGVAPGWGVTNSGVIAVQSNAYLDLDSYTTNGLTLADGTDIECEGNMMCGDNSAAPYLTATGTITINGPANAPYGTFQLAQAAMVSGSQTWTGTGSLGLNAATFYQPGTTTFATNFQVYAQSWSQYQNASVNIDGHVVNNLGTFYATNLYISDLGNAGTFNNLGTVVLGNSLLIGEWNNTGSAGSSFNNLGTILVSSNTYGWLGVAPGWAVTNSGVIAVQSNAYLDLDSYTTNGLTLADGTDIECEGNMMCGDNSAAPYLTATGTITINGPANAPYGTLQLSGMVSGSQTWTGTGSLGLNACTFYQPGTTTFATNFQVYAQSGNPFQYSTIYIDGHVVNNRGTFTVSSGDLLNVSDLGHPARFNNCGSLVLDAYLTFGGLLGNGYTNVGSSFNNSGTIVISPGQNFMELESQWNFTNSGTMNVGANSELYLSALNLTLNDGTTFIGAGQTELDFAYNWPTNTGFVTANGTINVNSTLDLCPLMILQGSQTWKGAGNLTWKGGVITQPGTTTIAPGLSFAIAENTSYGDGSVRLLTQHHVLNNQSALVWNTTFPVQMSNGALFQNCGVVSLQQYETLQANTSDCAFNNLPGATLNVVNGSSFNCTVTNQGSLNVLSGHLTLGKYYSPGTSSQCQVAVNDTNITPIATSSFNPGGILAVSLANGITVTNGTQFALVNYSSRQGQFAKAQLPTPPSGLQWQLLYGPSALTLTASGPSQQTNNRPVILSDGSFQFTFNGPATNSYFIQASTNLVDWVTLETISPFTGQISFNDPEATNSLRRFYRGVPGN